MLALAERRLRPLWAALLFCACQSAPVGEPASCVSTDPGCGFDVLAYEVALTPSFSDSTIAGSETIRLVLRHPDLQRLPFSGNALDITSVRIDGRDATLEQDADALWVVLPEPGRVGDELRIELSIAGAPARGIAWTDRTVHTSYVACDWMLCPQDAFGDKAPIALDLVLPVGSRSLGPGRLTEVVALPSGQERHVWREDRDYSAYLYAFAAGDFAVATSSAGAVGLDYLSVDATPDELAALFAPTADMLAFFESKAGVPFPHARYAQLLVAGSAAQEEISHAILGRNELEPTLENPQDDWAIAHELAHQWWGNLVTANALSEFWLNEGVTTFMTAAWKEHRWGPEAYAREIDGARGRWMRAAEAFEDVPLTFAGDYPTLGVRRGIQYGKGAVFLDVLRRELGEEAFWTGLAGFTRENAGGVVVSRDLQDAFETASGRSLQALFDEWVY